MARIIIPAVILVFALISCDTGAKSGNQKQAESPIQQQKAAVVAMSVETACPNGTNSQASMVKKVVLKKEKGSDSEYEEFVMETVDMKDKCYNISYGEFIYLVDEAHAVYKVRIDYYSNPLVYLDFGNNPVKHRQFRGIIKGTGTFTEYKDGQGIPRKMPYMLVIKEQ